MMLHVHLCFVYSHKLNISGVVCTVCVTVVIRIFVEKLNNLSALDTEYSSGIPELYANIDRQFHVNVPCRSKFGRNHECTGPATVVFRVSMLLLYSGTPQCHQIWTLSLVSIVYKTIPELKTPLKSEQLHVRVSQWCSQ